VQARTPCAALCCTAVLCCTAPCVTQFVQLLNATARMAQAACVCCVVLCGLCCVVRWVVLRLAAHCNVVRTWLWTSGTCNGPVVPMPVLCCAVFCCAVLHCALLRCTVLCCAVLCCALPCHAVPCGNGRGQVRTCDNSAAQRVLRCGVPCRAALCCAVPRRAALRRAEMAMDTRNHQLFVQEATTKMTTAYNHQPGANHHNHARTWQITRMHSL